MAEWTTSTKAIEQILGRAGRVARSAPFLCNPSRDTCGVYACHGTLVASRLVLAAGRSGVSSSDRIRRNELIVKLPAGSWKALIAPAAWWNGEHTYSSDPEPVRSKPRGRLLLREVCRARMRLPAAPPAASNTCASSSLSRT
jgi:hypothetical protein